MARTMLFCRKHILPLAALAALWPALALSDSGTSPKVSGEVAGDTAIITFSWPHKVAFSAAIHESELIVSFEHEASPSFGGLLKSLYPYVISVERKTDGKTLVFYLDRPYQIRPFAKGVENGVELLGIDPSARPAAAKTLAALSPAAGEEPVAPPAEEKPAEPVPQAATPPEVEPQLPVVAAPDIAEPPPPAEAASTPEQPTPPDEVAKPAAAADRIKVSVSAAGDNAVLRLSFPERAALAVFVRARFLWVAWHKPLPADLTDFDELPRTVIGKAESVPAEGATVIRMPIDDGVFLGVAKEENSFDWAILITPKTRGLDKELPVQANTDPPAPAHVFIPALETSDPVTVTDPQVKDQIIITPSFAVSEGIGVLRDFVEFSVLQTAQGVAVVKKADDAAVMPLRNGLRVSMPQGATITPGLPKIQQSQLVSSSQQTATLFPYEQWKLDVASEDPIKQKQALLRRVVFGENQQEANDARLRLAQIALGQGLAAEAMGYLDGINRTNPAFYRSSKLNAMRGAANFLMHRFIEASRDFAAAELNNNKEVDYWRGMLGDLLGNPDQNYDYLALNADYISKYPPIFRQRLAIVAADRSIGAKDYNTALKIFDSLTQDNIAEPITNYVNFLMAKISADNNQEKEALEMWDKLAVDYRRPFVQARAEFSRILWGMVHNALAKVEAIDRLERLRLAWHGDGLELNILTMLGDLYADRRDYVNAMRIWHGAITAFPNTAASLDMSRKMQEAFITMFNEGVADKLPPLEALSLYYEYHTYTPTGNTGNEIINRLAERLASVDLLDQAAALLDRQMRFQSEKEKRSELGTRLATIHLLNHQPKKALQALQDSVYGENPLGLRLLRNRLTAQAMADIGAPADKILQALGTDNSQDAEQIRISVYWKEKDWAKLTGGIENILKTRKDLTAPVTLDESEYLLRLALAYVFQNDRAQLRYLHDYFGPLMAGNPNQPMFEFITGGDIQLTTTNFDEVIKNIADTRSFIDKYSARIQTAESTPPAATAKP